MTRAIAADLAEGAQLYDAGEYWAAHEAWESTWRRERDAARRVFVQGLIQIAAALHKLLVMKNAEAAARVLTRAIAKLDGVADDYDGIDVVGVRDGAKRCLAAIEAIHAANAAPDSFDRALVPPLRSSAAFYSRARPSKRL